MSAIIELLNFIYILLYYARAECIILHMDIKDLRKELNMTQSEFGNMFGIPMRTIQEWESGRRKPPDYVLHLIVENLTLRGLLPQK